MREDVHMRAVRLHDQGLSVDEIDVPRPGVGEALVQVHAAGITRDELTWREQLPVTPSYELSGVVSELGDGAADVVVGDEVFALMPFDRDGAAADYAVVPAAGLAPKPQRLSHAESAALTLAGLSAWQGLFDHGALRDGGHVRILGTDGGVGHLAVQLVGDALAGPDEPYDLVFDTAGGEALAAAVGSAPQIVSVAEEADGVTYFIVEPNRTQLIELGRRADAGELSVIIDSTFTLDDAPAAFARVAERGKHGKVVLVPGA
jgi:NADPH:quinone reductase-like Zn-dependent oxidoreductase